MNLDKKILMVVGMASAIGGFVGGIAHAALTYMREPHSHKAHDTHEGNHLLEGTPHPGTANHKMSHPAAHPEGRAGDGHSHPAHDHQGHSSGHKHHNAHENKASDPMEPAPDVNDEPGHNRQHDDSSTRGSAGSAQSTRYALYRESDTLPALEPSLF